MGITVQNGKQLTPPPDGAAIKYVVADTGTGKYHAVNAAGDGGGGGTTTGEPYPVDGDFEIALNQHQVLEYVCFIGLPDATDITFETEENTGNIKTVTVVDAQPVILMTYMDADKTVFVKGVPAGILIKTKIS